MGALGWNLRQDSVRLEGVVAHAGRSEVDDHDWDLLVDPDPPFRYLLVNSHNEQVNDGGNDYHENLVTCEIQPIPAYDSRAAFERFFKPLKYEHVIVTGAWVEDRSHPIPIIDDIGTPFSFPPKIHTPFSYTTEIHPITSVLREVPGDPEVKEYELFVFCDDSNRNPYGSKRAAVLSDNGVFFSDTSRVAEFRMAFPPVPQPVVTPFFREVTPNPDDFAPPDNRFFRIVSDGYNHVLVARIESGTGPDHGFYHGRFQLWYRRVAWRSFVPSPPLRLLDGQLVHDVDAAIELRNPASLDLPPTLAPRVHTFFGPQSETFDENPIARRNQQLLRDPNGRFDYSPSLLSYVRSAIADDVQLGASLSLPQPAVQIVGCADAVGGTRFTYRFTGRAVLVSLFGAITLQWQIAGGRNLRDQSGDGTDELQFTFDYDAHDVPVVTVTVTDTPGQSASDVVDVGFCLSEAARTAITESRERLLRQLQLEIELGPALGVVPRGGVETTATLRNTVRQADELWRLARSAKRAETREDLPHVAKRLEKAMRETQAAAAIGIREWKIASQLRASGQFPEKSST